MENLILRNSLKIKSNLHQQRCETWQNVRLGAAEPNVEKKSPFGAIFFQQNIKVVARLNPSITQGFRKDEDKFDYNKDADRFVCLAGRIFYLKNSIVKELKKLVKSSRYLLFWCQKFKPCPLKNGCYKEKAKHGYKIETKNSELKELHGFDRAVSYRKLKGYKCKEQWLFSSVNLKRILKLI